MPCIWGQHNGSQLICAVAILPVGAISAPAPQGAPYLGPVSATQALIDTGATTTCISASLASALQLQPIGKVAIHGVAGIAYHNNYLFHVAFPFALPPSTPPPPGLPPPQPGQVQGQVFVFPKIIQGPELRVSPTAGFRVLLGMDIICSGSLVVQGGNGTFSFSF
jgi:Aspartyl protease